MPDSTLTIRTGPAEQQSSRTASAKPAAGEVPHRLWLYSLLDRLPLPRTFVAKIMLVCFVGIHVPLISLVVFFIASGAVIDDLIVSVGIVTLLATLGGTAATLLALYALIGPISLTARSLKNFLQHGTLPHLPHTYRDEVGQMMRDLQSTITQLEAALTAMRAAKDQAVEHNHANADFMAQMSHEMKTPLNAVLGFSEMMQTETFGPLGNPKYEEYAREIRNAGRHLLELVSDTLSLSRGELERVEIDDESLELGAQIRNATSMVSSLTHQAHIHLTLRLAHEDRQLLADRRALHQMLLNLLSNAIKFTPDGGHVSVRTWLERGQLVLSVRDTGVGIEPDAISQILLPFGQAGAGQEMANARQPGTGLGLPVVKMMIEAHGGEIRISSEPGKGSEFMLVFPPHRTV